MIRQSDLDASWRIDDSLLSLNLEPFSCQSPVLEQGSDEAFRCEIRGRYPELFGIRPSLPFVYWDV